MARNYKGVPVDKMTPEQQREYEDYLWHAPLMAMSPFGKTLDSTYDFANALAQGRTLQSVAIAVRIGEAFKQVNMSDGAREAAFEIVITQMAFALARENGVNFDSFKFNAMCKGRKE